MKRGANDIDCWGESNQTRLWTPFLGYQTHTRGAYKRAALSATHPYCHPSYRSLPSLSRLILVTHPVTCVIDINTYVHLILFWGLGGFLLNKGQCQIARQTNHIFSLIYCVRASHDVWLIHPSCPTQGRGGGGVGKIERERERNNIQTACLREKWLCIHLVRPRMYAWISLCSPEAQSRARAVYSADSVIVFLDCMCIVYVYAVIKPFDRLNILREKYTICIEATSH